MASKRALYFIKDVNKLQSVTNKAPLTVIRHGYASWEPVDKETHTGQVSETLKNY